ncbi:3-oxoacyl-ACP reductase family protein [Tepidiforma sp.]|uniref:SDR family NAD(P)-dependent oxidoreductase n=1 Tax=Tepidiforma sp. TaxID=2682230 RepID=UPI002ADE8166|nr:3-oxoacyl-ACP reductase family protein [Tepidiforma sp.]
MERFSLEGKTALVTGGSRGIGFAVARAFIEAGARVVIAARNEGQLAEAAAALGVNCIGLRCDVSDPGDIARLVARAWELGPLDVLVNNAGISPYYKRAELVSVEEFDAVVRVNLRGSYFASVEVARRMFEAGRGGSIINVSSVAGIMPLERQGVYAATKAGLHQLTKVMALEWAERGVRVNAIAPGWVETDLVDELFASRHGERLRADIPLGRLATPDDVAGAAVWLASDAASYVTGSVVVIDGGRQLR